MSWLDRLKKPEYVMQPARLVRRLRGLTAAPRADGTYALPMPWGLTLTVRALDDVARGVDTLGVHDLVVTESIWRLATPGDTLIDAGANVGYMTLVMMARLASRGRVFAFEPQPGVFDELSANVGSARMRYPGVDVELCSEALSESEGTAPLILPDATQRGQARIDPSGTHTVSTRRLDGLADAIGPRVSVMKLDVERHEPAVLRGAARLLRGGVVRNVIMEEHELEHPTEATALLQDYGYTIFALERTFWGVRLGEPGRARRTEWQAPSILATHDPDRVRKSFRAPGWRALES
jgi:FkbM family methyltransferase